MKSSPQEVSPITKTESGYVGGLTLVAVQG